MPTAALLPCPVPRCPTLTPGGGRCPLHARLLDQPRANRAVRRWYFTARWRRLRLAVLADACQTCAACGQVRLELDIDHIVPHQGDAVRFWDRANLQALCHGCHSAKTRHEGGRRPPGG